MTTDNIPLGEATVAGVRYTAICRRRQPIMAAQLEEGDLFISSDNPDEVLVAMAITGISNEPETVVIQFLYVTGVEKGKTDNWATDFDSLVWLAEFVSAPVF